MVGAVAALLLAGLAAAVDVEVLRLTAGPARTPDPLAHPAALAAGAALAVGCAWAGVLAAATFRTTALGLSAVLAVPLLVAPAVRTLIGGHATRELGDAGGALWSVVSGASQGGGGTVARMLRLAGQPFFVALALSLAALAGACAAGALLGRWRGRRSTAVQTGPTAQLSGKKG